MFLEKFNFSVGRLRMQLNLTSLQTFFFFQLVFCRMIIFSHIFPYSLLLSWPVAPLHFFSVHLLPHRFSYSISNISLSLYNNNNNNNDNKKHFFHIHFCFFHLFLLKLPLTFLTDLELCSPALLIENLMAALATSTDRQMGCFWRP